MLPFHILMKATQEEKDEIIRRLKEHDTIEPMFRSRVRKLVNEAVENNNINEQQFRLLMLLSGSATKDMFVLDYEKQTALPVRSTQPKATLAMHKETLVEHIRLKGRRVQLKTTSGVDVDRQKTLSMRKSTGGAQQETITIGNNTFVLTRNLHKYIVNVNFVPEHADGISCYHLNPYNTQENIYCLLYDNQNKTLNKPSADLSQTVFCYAKTNIVTDVTSEYINNFQHSSNPEEKQIYKIFKDLEHPLLSNSSQTQSSTKVSYVPYNKSLEEKSQEAQEAFFHKTPILPNIPKLMENGFAWELETVKFFLYVIVILGTGLYASKTPKEHQQLKAYLKAYSLDHKYEDFIDRGLTLKKLNEISDDERLIVKTIKQLRLVKNGLYGKEIQNFREMLEPPEDEENEEDYDEDEENEQQPSSKSKTKTQKVTSSSHVSTKKTKSRSSGSSNGIVSNMMGFSLRITPIIMLAFYIQTTELLKDKRLPSAFSKLGNNQFLRIYMDPSRHRTLSTRDIRHDTNSVPYAGCLYHIDSELHELFSECTKVERLRYHLLTRYDKRSRLKERRILPLHIFRNNGEVRESPNEIARAMKHHWEFNNIVGILRSKVGAFVKNTRKRVLRNIGGQSTVKHVV